MWYFLHKTVNIITGEYFYGIHQSFDMYFGRRGEGSWDPHLGSGAKLTDNVEQHGRHNFIVQSLFCHPDKEEVQKRFKDLNIDYNDPLCLNGFLYTPERNKKISESLKGYRQSAEHRKRKPHNKKWITDGENDRYVPKDDPIPEGWKEGRAFKPRVTSK